MKKIDKKSVEQQIKKVPYFLVILLIIVLAPIGVWFLIVKLKNDKTQIYNRGRALIGMGIFIIFLLGIGIYSKIKEIIVLYDSGMSFDMINFFPDNIFLYIIGLVWCVSFLMGGKKLMEQAKIERIYINLINIEKETSIGKISKQVNASLSQAKKNIKKLQDGGFLISLEVDSKNNKIIYKEEKNSKRITRSNKEENKKVQCSECGAIVSLKLDEYVECDFCGHGLIEEDNH